MTRHYRDPGSASYCRAVCEICFNQSEALLTRHQYGISALVSQTSFPGGISGSVAKCRLFSQLPLAWPEQGLICIAAHGYTYSWISVSL